jgi:predicted ATPase
VLRASRRNCLAINTGPDDNPGMSLLERGDALESLGEYLLSAREGEGRLVLVSGEAGVGKSALVEAFQAGSTQARWAWGTCDGLFTPRPLGPLFELADQLGGALAAAGRADAPREELFETLLRQLQDPPATVAVIEDLHWADEATLDLVRYLGRRVRSTRALLVLTYRDDGPAPDHPLRVVLGELATLRTTRRVSVAPLSEGAVRLLAAGSGIEPAELYRLTSGNPFFVTEVVRAGVAAVPVSAADAVRARLAGSTTRREPSPSAPH